MSLPKDVEGVRVLAERLAREHVAAGGKVVGYLTPCVPAELIEAAGMRPMMLSGGTERSMALGDRVMEDLFDTALRAVFERLLKGEFDYLSAIVLPRANDSAHRYYYYLSELARMGEASLPPVLLCDVVMTPDEASGKYSVDALGRLWDQLQALGWPADDRAQISLQIAYANARTATLEALVEARRTGAVGGAEALAMFAAARMLPHEVFQESTDAIIATRAPKSGARVMICGSTQHDAGLHGLVEAAGGVVVGDYHAGGELSAGRIMIAIDKPLEVLAERLRGDLAASRRFVDAGPHVARFAADSGAKLAIFSYFPEEEALTWDYPEQKAALEKAGVRVLRLVEQTRPFDVRANRAAVEAFVREGGG